MGYTDTDFCELERNGGLDREPSYEAIAAATRAQQLYHCLLAVCPDCGHADEEDLIACESRKTGTKAWVCRDEDACAARDAARSEVSA